VFCASAAAEAADETAPDLPQLISQYCCDLEVSSIEDGVPATGPSEVGRLCVDTDALSMHEISETASGTILRIREGPTVVQLECEEPPCEPTDPKGWNCTQVVGGNLPSPLNDAPFRYTAPFNLLVSEVNMSITLNQSAEGYDDYMTPHKSRKNHYMHWHVGPPAATGRKERQLLALKTIQPASEPGRWLHTVRTFSNCADFESRQLPDKVECRRVKAKESMPMGDLGNLGKDKPPTRMPEMGRKPRGERKPYKGWKAHKAAKEAAAKEAAAKAKDEL